MDVIAHDECPTCGYVRNPLASTLRCIGGMTWHEPAEWIKVEYVPAEQLRGAVDALQAIATGAPGTDYEFGYNDDAIVPMNLANRALKQLEVS